jgi:hypothetical protein
LNFGGIGGFIGAKSCEGRRVIRRHKWSILSLAITVGMWVAIGSYTQYQYRVHHVTDFTHTVVPALGGCSVLASVATGIAAAMKEKASPISLVAIALGAFSIVFYTV